MLNAHTKRLARFLALFMTLAVLAGCAASPGTSTPGTAAPEQAGTFNFLITAEPTTLDPAMVTDGPSITVVENIFDAMVNFDPKGEIVPALADSWKVSADGTVYTFTLNGNATFHNGRKVTATDLKWSWERALNKDLKSTVAMLYLGDILGAQELNDGATTELAGAKVVNDTTIEVTLVGNRPYFLSKMTYPTSAAVPKEVIEQLGDKWTETPVGTGPFKLKEWVHNNKVVLVRNEEWYRGKAKVGTINIAIVPDEQTAWGMYQAGQLDATYIPTSDLKRTLADANLSKEYLGWADAGTGYLAMNVNVFAPFADMKVRQAFNHAIDKDALIAVALDGTYERANTILPPTMPGYNGNLTSLQFDVARAKQLMADAGYPDGKNFPKLTITVRAQRETFKKIAEFIQNQLSINLNIDVAVVEVEWGVMLADIRAKDKVPAYVLSWGADYLDPENFLSILFRSDSSNARTGYKNASLDKVIVEGNTAIKWADRLKAYAVAEQTILTEAVWVPLYHPKTHMLVKPHIQGLTYNALGFQPFANVTSTKK